jgi:capsular polysaccharide transport system permease protein
MTIANDINSSEPRASLGEALAIQLRVIGALTMREIHTRYGRKNIGFLWMVFEPIMFTFGVIAMRSFLPYGGEGHGIKLVPFLMTGYMPFLVYRHLMSHSIHCIKANQYVLYHRQVKIIDLFIVQIILEASGIIIGFTAGTALFNALGLMPLPSNLLLLFAGWFYAIWFCSAFGVLVGAVSTLTPFIEKIYNPFSYLSLPISGAFFMVSWLPGPYQKIAEWVPLVNYFEMLRSGFFGPLVHPHYDTAYLTSVCLVLTFAALAMLRYIRPLLAVA